MANIRQSLEDLLTVDGAMCAAVVDSSSGMMLGSAGSGVDLEVAAAGNTEVVRAKLKVMRHLGLNDVIDDILVADSQPGAPRQYFFPMAHQPLTTGVNDVDDPIDTRRTALLTFQHESSNRAQT